MELKAVIVGDADVGKTSLSSLFCHGHAPGAPTPTIGASFLQKKMTRTHPHTQQQTEVMLQLWDTAGQERFRSMAPMYYRGARAALIVFDVTKPHSYHGVEQWHRDLKAYAESSCAVAIAGNKADQHHPDFDPAHAKQMFDDLGIPFMMTSALSGLNVDHIFELLIDEAMRNLPNEGVAADNPNLNLSELAAKQKKKACC